MNISATTREAYQLLHEGSLALAWIEQQGIHIDTAYCNRADRDLKIKIRKLEERLHEYDEVKYWKKRYGVNFKFGSDEQLRHILFDHLGLKSTKETESGLKSVDQEVLQSIDLPFTNDLIPRNKYEKAKETYIGNIQRETVKGYLHPFFHLHFADTYRSSSSQINFQNQPNRDKEIKKIIRQAFIPRPGHQLGGFDYGRVEICSSACYHKDPVMVKYIKDPTTDMHRDMAEQCFILPRKEVHDDVRGTTKGGFVFPEFYGDYYVHCAENLWNDITMQNLKTVSGMPLKEHLRDSGIKSLKQFEKHIREVENDFWNNRFSVYNEWKNDWVKKYEKDGYLEMYTGFRCSGVLSRNQIVNYAIQGTAFHWLLWVLIQLVKWYRKRKLRSRIVGQIHDEGVMDNHPDEIDMIMTKTYKVACLDIRQHWPWITVPLEIDAKFTDVDKPWNTKKPFPINLKGEF